MALDRLNFSSIFGEKIGGVDYIKDLTENKSSELGINGSNKIKTETLDFSDTTKNANVPNSPEAKAINQSVETNQTNQPTILGEQTLNTNQQTTNVPQTQSAQQNNQTATFGPLQNQSGGQNPYEQSSINNNFNIGGGNSTTNSQTPSTQTTSQTQKYDSPIGPQQIRITEEENKIENSQNQVNSSTGSTGGTTTGSSTDINNEQRGNNITSNMTQISNNEKEEQGEKEGQPETYVKNINENLSTKNQYAYDVEQNRKEEITSQINIDEYKNQLKKLGLREEDIEKVISGNQTIEQLMEEIENDKDTGRKKEVMYATYLKQFGYEYGSMEELKEDQNNKEKKLEELKEEKENIEKNREYEDIMSIIVRIQNGEKLDYILKDEVVTWEVTDKEGNIEYIYEDLSNQPNYDSTKNYRPVLFEEKYSNNESINKLREVLEKDGGTWRNSEEQNSYIKEFENSLGTIKRENEKRKEEIQKEIEETYNEKEKSKATYEYITKEVDYYIENVDKYLKDDVIMNNTEYKNDGENKIENILNIENYESDGTILQYKGKEPQKINYRTDSSGATIEVNDKEELTLIIYTMLNEEGKIEDDGIHLTKEYNGVRVNITSKDSMLYHYRKWKEQMTDKEKEIFNGKYNAEGYESAYKYLEDISNELDNRWLTQKTQEDQEFADNHPALASIGSVIKTPFEGMSAACHTLNSYMSGKNIKRTDIYSAGDVWRNEVSQLVAGTYGEGWAFTYNTGMSMADTGGMIAASAVTGGGAAATSVLSTSLMGSRVYVSTLNEAKDRGLEDKEAVLLAASAAITESAMESYSAGHLLNLEEKLGEGVAKSTAKLADSINNKTLSNIISKGYYLAGGAVSQGICEGEEEFATEIVNYVTDRFISKDLSNYEQSISKYLELGYTEKDALLATMKDFSGQAGQAFLGGMISGACFGTFGAAKTIENTSNNIATNMIKKYEGKTYKELLSENNITIKEVQQNSKATNTDNTYVDKLQQINESGEKITADRANENSSKEVYKIESELKKAAQDIKKINKQDEKEQNKLDDEGIRKYNEYKDYQNLLERCTNRLSNTDIYPGFDKILINKTNLVKAAIMLPGSIFSSTTRYFYQSINKNTDVLNSCVENGLYHLTTEENAQKILESGYIKKSKGFTTNYGKAKTFLFNGIPSVEDVCTNCKLQEKYVAIKLNPDAETLQNPKFTYRNKSDGAIAYYGDVLLENKNADIKYLILVNENGKLKYKEVAKDVYDDYKINDSKVFDNKVNRKVAETVMGLTGEFNHLSNQITGKNNNQSRIRITDDIEHNRQIGRIQEKIENVTSRLLDSIETGKQKVLEFIGDERSMVISGDTLERLLFGNNGGFFDPNVFNQNQYTPYEKDSFVVVSDFHGADWVMNKVKSHYMNEYETIFNLGDITDRGKVPFELLGQYMDLSKQNPNRVIYVPGNHDSFLYGAYMAPDEQQRMNYRKSLNANGGTSTINAMDNLRATNPARFNEIIIWLGNQPLQRIHTYNGKKYALAHAFFNKNIYNRNPNYALKDYVKDVHYPNGLKQAEANILWFRKGKDSYNPADLPSSDYTMVVGHTPNADNLSLGNVNVICVDGAASKQDTQNGSYSTRKFDGGSGPEYTFDNTHNDTSHKNKTTKQTNPNQINSINLQEVLNARNYKEAYNLIINGVIPTTEQLNTITIGLANQGEYRKVLQLCTTDKNILEYLKNIFIHKMGIIYTEDSGYILQNFNSKNYMNIIKSINEEIKNTSDSSHKYSIESIKSTINEISNNCLQNELNKGKYENAHNLIIYGVIPTTEQLSATTIGLIYQGKYSEALQLGKSDAIALDNIKNTFINQMGIMYIKGRGYVSQAFNGTIYKNIIEVLNTEINKETDSIKRQNLENVKKSIDNINNACMQTEINIGNYSNAYTLIVQGMPATPAQWNSVIYGLAHQGYYSNALYLAINSQTLPYLKNIFIEKIGVTLTENGDYILDNFNEYEYTKIINAINEVEQYGNNINYVEGLKQELALIYTDYIQHKNNGIILKNEINNTIDRNWTQLEKARKLYIELNKRLRYDVSFYKMDEAQQSEFIKRKINFSNLNSDSIICSSWSQLYYELLVENGFDNSDVKIMGGEKHKWIEINIGNGIIIADATEAIDGATDLVNCKIGYKTHGFFFSDNNRLSGRRLNELYENNTINLDSVKNLYGTIDSKIGYSSSNGYKYELIQKANSMFSSNNLNIDDGVYRLVKTDIPKNMDGLEVYSYFKKITNLLSPDEKSRINLGLFSMPNGNSYEGVFVMKYEMKGQHYYYTFSKKTGINIYDNINSYNSFIVKNKVGSIK